VSHDEANEAADSTPVDDGLAELEERLGHRFTDRSWLQRALTHSSAIDAGGPRLSERLEFLGDAVLDLAVSEMLLQEYPVADEGKLSRYRASLVNEDSFATMAESLGLGSHLNLSKGEERSGGRRKPSILADAYEATLGAVFLDGGYAAASHVVRIHFAELIADVESRRTIDAKTALQERCQQARRTTPFYRVIEEAGPDHAREFVVEVVLDTTVLASGRGRSKRAAEQAAARAVLADEAIMQAALASSDDDDTPE